MDPGSIVFAFATGVTIATYARVDRVGTRLIDPVPYAAILWVTASLDASCSASVVAGRDTRGA